MNDIETIRNALDFFYDHYLKHHGLDQAASNHAHNSDDALDRVRDRTLPELPEYPWLCLEGTSSGYVAYFDYGGADDGNVLKSKPAIGATIPAAIQAAIEKIGDAK